VLPTSGCVRLERARCRKLSDWFCFFLCREKHGAMKRINWQVENRLRKHLRDHYTKRKKSYAEFENSEGQCPTESADASANEAEVKGYRINQLS